MFLEDLEPLGLAKNVKGKWIPRHVAMQGWNVGFDYRHLNEVLSASLSTLYSARTLNGSRHDPDLERLIEKNLAMRKGLQKSLISEASAFTDSKRFREIILEEIGKAPEGSSRLHELHRLSKKGLYTLEDTYKVLGVTLDDTVFHEGASDVKTTWAVLSKAAQDKGLTPFFNSKIADVMRRQEDFHNGAYVWDEPARVRFATNLNEQISAMGGRATLGRGVLSGLDISSIRYRNKGRYAVNLAQVANFAEDDIGIMTTDSPAHQLSAKLKRSLASDGRRGIVTQAYNMGLFKDESAVEEMVKFYANNPGASSRAVVLASGRNLGKVKSGAGYLAPATRIKALRTLGHLDELKLAPDDVMGKAISVAEASINEVMGTLASSAISNRSTLSEREGARAIDRFQGGVEPLERLRGKLANQIKSVIHLTEAERKLVGNIDTMLASNVYADMLMGFMRSGETEMGTGLSSLNKNFSHSGFDSAIGKIERARFKLMKGVDIAKVARDAVVNLPVERQREVLDAIQDILYPTVRSVAASGEGARFRLFSRTIRAGIAQAFPGAYANTLMAGEEGSAIAQLDSLHRGLIQYMGDNIATGAVAGSKYGSISKREPGLWRLSEAIGGMSPEELSPLYADKETREFVESVRDYAVSGKRSNQVFNMSDDKMANVAGYVSRITNSPLNVSAIQKELAIQSVFSMEGLVEAGRDIAGATNTEDAAINRVMAPIKNRVSKKAYRLVRNDLTSWAYGQETTHGIDASIQRTLGYTGELDEAQRSNMTQIGQSMQGYLKTRAGKAQALITLANEEVMELAQTAIESAERYKNLPDAFEVTKSRAAFYDRFLTDMFTPRRIMTSDEGGKTVRRLVSSDSFLYNFDEFGERVNTSPSAFMAGLESIGQRIDEALFGIPVATRATARDIMGQEIGSAIVKAYHNIPGAMTLQGVKGSVFGLSPDIKKDAISFSIPGQQYMSGDELLTDGKVLMTTHDGKVIRTATGRNRRGLFVPANTILTTDPGVGYNKGSSSMLVGVGGIPFENEAGDLISGMQTSRMMGDDEFDSHIRGLMKRARRESGITAARTRRYGSSSSIGMAAAEVTADALKTSSKGLRSIVTSAKDTINKTPVSWKVLAAGAAALGAITMLRRSQPLLPQDGGAYGGGAGNVGQYPVAPAQITPVSTYLGQAPTRGMRASISGVVGPNVNISDLQTMVGNMGFANMNISDNSKYITPKDIDQMISDRLA